MKPLRLAIVGCGQISTQYGEHITQNHPHLLEIAGATDLDSSRVAEFTDRFGGQAYPDLDAILADDSVDLLLNLAIHHAHFEINKKALLARKHVFSEKPMALTHAQASELADLARKNGVRLAAAPATFLGEGLQTAFQFLRSGRTGPLRLVYAEVNWGQIERWIGSPTPYFAVGPLMDVGVYALTALAFLLGPVQRVWGVSRILKNPRLDPAGNPFPVTAPDFTTGLLEYEGGVVARLTTNYYVHAKGMPHLRGLEFHGDEGSFRIGCFHNFDPACSFVPYQDTAIEVPLVRPAKAVMERAAGLADLALALRENRPHRCSAELAAHVIDVMESLQLSAVSGHAVDVHSGFPAPAPMEWASPQIPSDTKPIRQT